MSINPLSSVSSIWSRAATALSGTQDSTALPPTAPPASGKTTEPDKSQTTSASTPFQKLASDLQSVLLQMQSSQGSQSPGSQSPGSLNPGSLNASLQSASLGQAPTGSAQQARPHPHYHQAPAADQSGGTSAVAGKAGLGGGLLSAMA